jgi:6-pyruvoyl-tetrahydropterin synthase
VLSTNPTAENLAAIIAGKANELLCGHGVEVVKVKLWETPNCFATWESA